MRLIGPFFVLFFYFMLSVHIYAHFAVVLFVLKKRLGVIFGLIWVAIGASLFYNIVYNQFFAMVVKPGGPKDLKVSIKSLRFVKKVEQLRKDIKQREGKKGLKSEDGNVGVNEKGEKVHYVEDDRFEGISKDVKSLLKYRNKTIGALDAAAWISTCSECNDIKPIRTRHCSVCNRCVFHIDHHSPWVNNCIGLEN